MSESADHLTPNSSVGRQRSPIAFYRPLLPRYDASVSTLNEELRTHIHNQHTSPISPCYPQSHLDHDTDRSRRHRSRSSHSSRSTILPPGIVAPELAYLNDATPHTSQSSSAESILELPPLRRNRQPRGRLTVDLFFPPDLAIRGREGFATTVSPVPGKGNGGARKRMRAGTPWSSGPEERTDGRKKQVYEGVAKGEAKSRLEKPEQQLEGMVLVVTSPTSSLTPTLLASTVEMEDEEGDEFHDAAEGILAMPETWSSSPHWFRNDDKRSLSPTPAPAPVLAGGYLRDISSRQEGKRRTLAFTTPQLDRMMGDRTPMPMPVVEPQLEWLMNDRMSTPISPVENDRFKDAEEWPLRYDKTPENWPLVFENITGESTISVGTEAAKEYYNLISSRMEEEEEAARGIPNVTNKHQQCHAYAQSVASNSPSPFQLPLSRQFQPSASSSPYSLLSERDIDEDLIAHWKTNPYANPSTSHGPPQTRSLSRYYTLVPAQAASSSPSPRPGFVHHATTSLAPGQQHPALSPGMSFEELPSYRTTPAPRNDGANSIRNGRAIPPSPEPGVWHQQERVLRTSRGRRIHVPEEFVRRVYANGETVMKSVGVGGDEGKEDNRAVEKINTFVERGRDLLIKSGVELSRSPIRASTKEAGRGYADGNRTQGMEQDIKNVATNAMAERSGEEERASVPTPISIGYESVIRGVAQSSTPTPGFNPQSQAYATIKRRRDSGSSTNTIGGPAATGTVTGLGVLPSPSPAAEIESGSQGSWSTVSDFRCLSPVREVIEDGASSVFAKFDGDHRTATEQAADTKSQAKKERKEQKDKVWWKKYVIISVQDRTRIPAATAEPQPHPQPSQKPSVKKSEQDQDSVGAVPNPPPPGFEKQQEMLEKKDTPEYCLLTRTLMKTCTNIDTLRQDLSTTTQNMRTTAIPTLTHHIRTTTQSVNHNIRTTIRLYSAYLKTRPKVLYRTLKTFRPKLLFPYSSRSRFRSGDMSPRSSAEIGGTGVGEQMVRYSAGGARGARVTERVMVRASENAMRMFQRWSVLGKKIGGKVRTRRMGRLLGRRRGRKGE